jgi:hypothetical protein
MPTLFASSTRQWSAVRWSLAGLETFVGVGALYGALMLITDAWGLPVDDLAPLPLHSWVLPGVALVVLVAIPMLGAALGTRRNTVRVADVSIAVGALLVGWIAVQLIVIGPQMFLQAVMLVLGLAITGLGWWWRTRMSARP